MSGYLNSAWGWLCWATKGVAASVYALWLQPAVWPAWALAAFLGFWVGHIDGARQSPGLRSDLKALHMHSSKLETERNMLKSQLMIATAKAGIVVTVPATSVAAPVSAPAVVLSHAKPKPVAGSKPKAVAAEAKWSLF